MLVKKRLYCEPVYFIKFTNCVEGKGKNSGCSHKSVAHSNSKYTEENDDAKSMLGGSKERLFLSELPYSDCIGMLQIE